MAEAVGVPEAQERALEQRAQPSSRMALTASSPSRSWVVGTRAAVLIPVLSLWGKVDEPFGRETVAGYIETAHRILAKGKNTNRLRRIEELTSTIAGTAAQDPRISGLRYQLLSGVAGTLAASVKAQPGSRAVFLIQEFITPEQSPSAARRTRRTPLAFIATVFGEAWAAKVDGDRWLIGPLRVPGGTASWGDRQLWIDHLTINAPSFELPDSEWDCFSPASSA